MKKKRRKIIKMKMGKRKRMKRSKKRLILQVKLFNFFISLMLI